MVQDGLPGVAVEGHNLAGMAFADDMILLAKDRTTTTGQLDLVYTELKRRGLNLSFEKSFTFEYKPRDKTWYIRDPELVLKGVPIPYSEPEKAFKYIGALVTSWRGIIEGFETQVFEDMLDRVKALLLKPMQKVALLRTYLLPRFTYGLIMRPPSKETLGKIDAIIRLGVKKILHLHETTNSAFLYTPTREGGLDLIETRAMVLIAALPSAIRATESSDEIVRKTILNEKSQTLLQSYAAAVKLPWPATLEQLNSRKKQIRQGYKTEWSQQPAKG